LGGDKSKLLAVRETATPTPSTDALSNNTLVDPYLDGNGNIPMSFWTLNACLAQFEATMKRFLDENISGAGVADERFLSGFFSHFIKVQNYTSNESIFTNQPERCQRLIGLCLQTLRTQADLNMVARGRSEIESQGTVDAMDTPIEASDVTLLRLQRCLQFLRMLSRSGTTSY
jgi:hypothetical protein